MTEVSCYSMDLYCDNDNDKHEYDEFPHNFVGRTRSGCAKKARTAGWVFRKNGTASCPKCRDKDIPTVSYLDKPFIHQEQPE